MVAAYGSIFVLGLVGNSLVILTLTRNKRVKVSCNGELESALPLSRILRSQVARFSTISIARRDPLLLIQPRYLVS